MVYGREVEVGGGGWIMVWAGTSEYLPPDTSQNSWGGHTASRNNQYIPS